MPPCPSARRLLATGCVIVALWPADTPSPADTRAAETASRARPDIVLISIDSLRRDHLGCYGYGPPTSPTIDLVASQGIRFDDAVSTTSWTLPAHAAMFTGLYDASHGAIDNSLRLGSEQLTLAEVLRDRGYRTGGFFGGPFLHPTFGLNQGFETWRSCMTQVPDDASEGAIRLEARAERGRAHGDVTGPRTVAEVGRWLEPADDRPMFLFVHLWDVHYDYIPPDRYAVMFDPGYRGKLTGVDVVRNPDIHPGMPPGDLRHLVALYDAEIRATDDTVSQLLRLLQRRGRLDDTLLVITADHGEEFFEHGGKGHVRTLFDEVVRVPLVMRWPSQLPSGMVIRGQVRLIDLMPTVLDLARVPSHALVQGRSLAPLIAGDLLPEEPALLELHVDGAGLRGLRSSRYKLIDPGAGGPSAGFDLLADPGERHPLRADGPGRPLTLADLARVLQDALDLRRRVAGALRPAPVEPETRERLRSLGYIGSQ